MKILLSTYWERLSSSYWFVPTLMSLAATGFSFLTIHFDSVINAKWARSAGWVWGGGPAGARSVLSTVASSTITVAGVVFSITIVALTLASSQFGPRLLRNFMSDRGTQIVLGVFVSTFLYCLLILRTVRGTEATSVIPFISVTCGIVFAVASVGFLIFFIHHVPNSILAETLLGRVARELQDSIDRIYPEELDQSPRERKSDVAAKLPPRFEEEAHPLLSHESGFIQTIAIEKLIALAARKGLIIRLSRRPGDFVAEESTLALAWPAEKVSEECLEEFRDSFFFGWHRTPTQDINYAIDQLVEVAVRSLSPGINDPFTAMSCVEWLGVGLIRVGRRQIPSACHYDEENKLRLVTDVTDYEGIAASALNQIRQYGGGSVAVVTRLLNMLTRVAAELSRAEDREVLLDHARAIREDGVAQAKNERDQRDIEQVFEGARQALSA
ncbi:MAG: DUF2254 domain-containing protein [Chthoniobacterales bacterium]